MTRSYFLMLCVLFAANFCYAQVDTEFWFVAPEVSTGHGDRPIYLRISTQDKPSNVVVTQPANADRQIASLTIPANTTQTIDLTSLIDIIETTQPAAVMKTGLKIVSSAPVTAYYEVGAPRNAEIFALKGKNAIGSRFIIPGQNFYNNSSAYSPTPYSSFDIVATRNNTVLTVRPTKAIFGHPNQDVITVKLNAGETYSFRKTTQSALDNPVGTIVESTKPIAITIKDDSVIDGLCRDVMGDQIVPVKVAGVEYVVQRGFLNAQEYVFITATEDGTTLFIAGGSQPVATLKAGEIYRHQITSKSTYILASKTIYVFHVTGFGCELGMAMLPSINCKGSQQIGFTRSTSEFFGLNILIRKEGINHFKLNGSVTLIPASAFTEVPGTNGKWYTAQVSYGTLDIPVGQASLIANDIHSFQVGIINGNATSTCRYGYFSAFSTLFIGDDFKFCEGETATIDAGTNKESYLWSTGETTQKIDVTNTGVYWVKAIKEECVLYDTIVVEVKKGAVDLGPDITICRNDTAKIDGKNNFSWKWSDGSTNQYLKTTTPGKYWVSVFDYTGCPASDTITVNWYVPPAGDFGNIKLNFVSVDTVEEKDVNLSWTTMMNTETIGSNLLLFKKAADGADWKKISTLAITANSASDKNNLTDEGEIAYYVSLLDFCREEIIRSDVNKTIHLAGQADTLTDVIDFSWNHYQEWSKGVISYELWRKLDDAPGYKFIVEVPGDRNTFSTEIAGDGFRHNYVIRANENDGNGESWSNNIQFEFDHPVYVPNVFTPNGDGHNQYFEITKIGLYKNSELLVLNRWGRPVFQSREYKNDWNGGDLEPGVYYYVLNLRKTNKIIKGTVSILK